MIWNSISAIIKDLKSIKFNSISTIKHWKDSIKLSKLPDDSFCKVHFGCGQDLKDGWLNLDVNNVADYYVDVRNPVKIKEGVVDFIYSSHMVEHLEHNELINHLKECYRILRKGGILRLGIPDFFLIINNYPNQDFLEKYRSLVTGERFGLPDNLICYIDLMNRAFYEFGQHKIVLDYTKMKNLLLFCGFKEENISEQEFDELYDLQIRKEATFYMQAKKI